MPQNTNKVAVVVLNWNGFDDTKVCIESLLEQSMTEFSVIVVDNGSHDSDLKKLNNHINTVNDKRLHLIKNRLNLGFSGGVNTGIRYALDHGFENIALLNNDARVHKQWLKELLSALKEHPDAGAVTGLLLNHDGSLIDSSGEHYSSWGIPFPRNRNEEASSAPDSGYVFSGTGGATLYRKQVFNTVGLFDESFFAYYEDVDIGFRSQLAGYKTFYTNKAIAHHKKGASSSKIKGFTVYQTFKNIPLLYIKNVPTRLLVPVGVKLAFIYTLFFANAIRRGNGRFALKGWLLSVLLFWTKGLPVRNRIQHHKKVTSKYILSIITEGLPPRSTARKT